ncbi:MAG TPA: ABC transporter permease [Candidatus Eisenbacteria bacterium]|nr:ABC transporter permease [Candidatus Eisenbacteria bacterium]
MEWWANLRMRSRGLRRGDDVHREIAEEWAFHVERRTEENIRRGMSAQEARLSAARSFGNSGYIKDLSWDERGGGVVETLWQDLRFCWRQLRKSPGFSIVALLSLTLGIGANAVIFSLVSTVLLRPLPIAHPEQVVAVHQVNERTLDSQSMAYPNYKDLRDRNQALSSLAVYRFVPASFSHSGTNERVWGFLVTGNYFEMLGVQPLLGRTFTPDEDREVAAHPLLVLSYGCWQRRFGRDPTIAGKTILVNGRSFVVIGVMKPEFTGTESVFLPEFWTPSQMQAWIEPDEVEALGRRSDGQWFAVGRLKPGVSAEQAQAHLNGIGRQLAKEYPGDDDGRMAFVLTPPGLVIPGLRAGVIAFSGALMLTVALVLLIACTNLACLLLARAVLRRKEIAVRMAIGATRWRLARQLLTESVLLSAAGGALGLGLGSVLMRLAQAAIPSTDFGLMLDLRLDWRVVGFVASLALLTGIGFGLIPALQASRSDVRSVLVESATGGRRRAWLRSVLVTMQLALSLMLLIAAGLTVRSLRHAETMGPGFVPEHVVIASVDVGLQGYDENKGRNFHRQLLDRVRALPGVESATLCSPLPLSLSTNTTWVFPDGIPRPPAGQMPDAIVVRAGTDYFATLHTALVAGREFSEKDKAGAPLVAVVNETFARRFWPGQNAVGKGFHDGGKRVIEIVGVARDGIYRNYGEGPTLVAFFPIAQWYLPNAVLVVRTPADPQSAIAGIRGEVRALDPTLPLYDVKTLEEHLNVPLFPLHAAAVAVGSFGVLALILATIGIYGVMAYSVSQSRQEIGIRMALGARPGDVWRMVLRRGIAITAAGVGIGLLGSFGVSRIVGNLLYGVSATDPMTFALISLLLCGVALVACFVPARRATKVDPVMAIRSL